VDFDAGGHTTGIDIVDASEKLGVYSVLSLTGLLSRIKPERLSKEGAI